MPKTLLGSRLRTTKHKSKVKQKPYNNKANLPSHLQTFEQKLLS